MLLPQLLPMEDPRNLPSSRRPVGQLPLNGHTPPRKRPLATGSKGSMRGIGPTCAAVRNVVEIGPVLNPSMERAAPYPDSYTRRSMIRKAHSARFPLAATGFAIALGFIATCSGLTWARWDDFHTVGHFIDPHAMLISAVGAGLLCVLVILHSVTRRIEALEMTVNHLRVRQ